MNSLIQLAEEIYREENPELKMDCPSCVYELVENRFKQFIADNRHKIKQFCKTGKVEVGKQIREFKISESQISCTNCDCCYGRNGKSKKEYRTFCQEFSFFVNPTEDEINNKRALLCPHWIFGGYIDSELSKGLSIRSVMTPNCEDHERWYEKDSMA